MVFQCGIRPLKSTGLNFIAFILIGFNNYINLFCINATDRVPLPYSNINLLNDDGTKVFSKVGIFTHSNERSELLINELNDMMSKEGVFWKINLFFLVESVKSHVIFFL